MKIFKNKHLHHDFQPPSKEFLNQIEAISHLIVPTPKKIIANKIPLSVLKPKDKYLNSGNHKSEPPELDDFVKLNLAQISRVEDSL